MKKIILILFLFLFANLVYGVEKEMYQLDLELRDGVIINNGINVVLVNTLELIKPKNGYKIEVLEGNNIIYTEKIREIKKVFVPYSKYADSLKVYDLNDNLALTIDVSDYQQVKIEEEIPGIIKEANKLKTFLFSVTGVLILAYVGLYFVFVNKLKK